MTGKMETPFYHDESVPNFGQIPDYDRYQGHKTMSKRNMAHNFSNGVGNNVSLKPRATLLPGQTVSNINPNGLGMSTNPMTSPDMNLLKLSSPDLEHLIIQSNQGLVTTSPAPNASANPFMYRNQATNEQEGFADGFVKALADLHKQNQLVGAPMSPTSSLQGSYQRNLMSSGEMPIYTNLSSYNPNPLSSAYASGQIAYASAAHASVTHASAAHASAAHASAAHASVAHASAAHASVAHASAAHTSAAHASVAHASAAHASAVHASAAHTSAHEGHHPPGRVMDAPQTVPEVPHPPGLDPASSPPSLSPIDLETQERIKTERKKLRNRIAASKCRKRKLERISRLEEKVKVLKTQNSDLATTASVLREQVAQLKHKVMNHVTNGCQIAVISTAVAKSGEGTSC